MQRPGMDPAREAAQQAARMAFEQGKKAPEAWVAYLETIIARRIEAQYPSKGGQTTVKISWLGENNGFGTAINRPRSPQNYDCWGASLKDVVARVNEKERLNPIISFTGAVEDIKNTRQALAELAR